eukprot:GEMP01037100.1.p1 GENE.GEMP01037100.1~~GEMP01037100.1.p1  ORF type:complete len:306 (+),score=34.12 GEMP01037100.1:109-918(+)
MSSQHYPSQASSVAPYAEQLSQAEEKILEALGESVLPRDVVGSIKKHLVLNRSDVPEPRWRRGGMHPLPLGLFRSSMVPAEVSTAVSFDVELSDALPGFSVEVTANVISGGSSGTDGVVCDLGIAGLVFIQGELTLWAKTTDGFIKTSVPAPRQPCHFLFTVVPGEEMVLFVDGVKVASEALSGRIEFKGTTQMALCRSVEGSDVQTCPWKAMRHVPMTDIETSCESCESKHAVGVLPTKGTLGAARVYDFALNEHQVHLAFLTGDRLR